MIIGKFVYMPNITSKSILKHLVLYHNNGIDTVCLVNEYPHGPSTMAKWAGPVIKKVRDIGLKTVVHAPFMYNDLMSILEEFRKLSVKDIKLSMDFARKLDSHSITIHLGGYTSFSQKEDLFKKILRKSLDEIISHSEETNIPISIENLPYRIKGIRFPYPSTWDHIDFILSEFKQKLCIDVGHLCLSKVDVHETLKKYIKHTNCIHLHDFDGETDHLPVGRGKLDFRRIFQILNDHRFRDPILIESMPFDKPSMESFNKLKELEII